MTYETIFTSTDDFRSYADGIQADTNLRQLLPSIRDTALEMQKIITPAAFAAIADKTPVQGVESATLDQGLELLKSALASGTLYRYAIFAAVKKNGTESSLYKYQHEEMKDVWVESYWRAMDALLDYLDANSSVGNWSGSEPRKDRDELPVKNAEEFDRYFSIGRSSLFYHKVLYLIRESWPPIARRISHFADDPQFLELAKRALCYTVLAKVVIHFDITEFPRSIRFDYNHEYTRGSSVQSRDRLHDYFAHVADTALGDIDHLIRAASGADSAADSNLETDKFFKIL